MSETNPREFANPVLNDHDREDLYEEVLRRRVAAFAIDSAFIAGAGILLLSIAFLLLDNVLEPNVLYIVLSSLSLPLYLSIFIPYVGFSLGGAKQATPGMQIMGIRIAKLDGRKVSFLIAISHGLLFLIFNSTISPLILVAALLLQYKQTVHDRLLGTVIVRTQLYQ